MTYRIFFLGATSSALLVALHAYPARDALARSVSAIAQTSSLDDSTVLRLIRERVDTRRNVGLVIGIIDSTGRRHVYEYGRLNGQGSPEVDANTVFEIGSITKTFTTTLLAAMVRQGEVALDDPVSKFLPSEVRMQANGRDITLEDLATQSSGLPPMPANFHPKNVEDPYADYGTPQLDGFLTGYTPPTAPGVKYEYSNLGVGLLGYVLSRRAGVPYERLIEQRVLAPLGMSDTRLVLTPDMKRRLAPGHNRDGDEVSGWTFDALASAGALRSTVNDLMRYVAANLDSTSRPLGAVLRGAHQPRRPTTIPNTQIGLAWHVLRVNNSDVIWHNGETGGYHSFIAVDPTRHVGVVVLSNSATSIDDLGMHLVDERIPLHLPPAPPIEVVQDSMMVDTYVGTYELAPGARMTVTRAGSKLYLQPTGQQRVRVFPTSDSTYKLTVVDAQLTFHHDAQGRVSEMELRQGGREMRGVRVR